MQRFGTHSIATHEIGKVLIRKDWTAAVNMILGQYAKNDSEAEKKTKLFLL
jgi:tRNA(Glu) U13 pseudouridine synthase TruD